MARDAPNSYIGEALSYKIKSSTKEIDCPSDSLGHLMLKAKWLSRKFDIDKCQVLDSLKVSVEYNGSLAQIDLNKYNDFYDIYFKPSSSKVARKDRIADMHYHVSMRSQNKHGYDFNRPRNPEEVPENINWDKSYKKLKVLYKGKWRPVKLKSRTPKQRDKLKILFEGKWVKSKDGANSLKVYSEATHPHIYEGNVYLAFNAISPFEHGVSRDGLKRTISSSFKTGAPIEWLKLLGKKYNYLTHWQNFNSEYELIKGQDSTYNYFEWGHLKRSSSIGQSLDKPLVVNVVEGGHILQNRYFPHFVNYDIDNRNDPGKISLHDEVIYKAKYDSANGNDQEKNNANYILKLWDQISDTPFGRLDSSIVSELGFGEDETFIMRKNSLMSKEEKERKGKLIQLSSPGYILKERARISNLDAYMKNLFVDSVLLKELNDNIHSLKKLDIHMMAIGHLSFNGMTGHALALDVSKRPFTEALISQLVKRAYHSKSSSDKNNRKSFDGLFFTIPGVNKFGQAVIDQLLDSTDIRKIHIDLKHSDAQTRRVILDEYKERDLPPICSHCAVSGIPISFNAPITDDYKLLSSSLARKFYPFGINLYNEEIEEICIQNGIIGIPLEERVLGGYVDNKIQWPRTIKLNDVTPSIIEKTTWQKRWSYTIDGIRYMKRSTDPSFKDVESYYDSILSPENIDRSNGMQWENQKDSLRFYKILCDDYQSAEPFLQNVFHIVDIAYSQKKSSDTTEFNDTNLTDRQLFKKIKSRMPMHLQKRIKSIGDYNLFYQKSKEWRNICIGSDLDGLIDPLNIVATASQYPDFKEKLKYLIPFFLKMRKEFEVRDKAYGWDYRDLDSYFNEYFTVDDALDMIFYGNLFEFTKKNFAK